MSNYFRFVLLTWLFICGIFSAKCQTSNLEQHILNLQTTVQNRRSIISELRANEAHMTPIGILGSSNGEGKPTIILDDIVVYPTYAEFNAYASVLLPGAREPIYFASTSPIKMSYDGVY